MIVGRKVWEREVVCRCSREVTRSKIRPIVGAASYCHEPEHAAATMRRSHASNASLANGRRRLARGIGNDDVPCGRRPADM